MWSNLLSGLFGAMCDVGLFWSDNDFGQFPFKTSRILRFWLYGGVRDLKKGGGFREAYLGGGTLGSRFVG